MFEPGKVYAKEWLMRHACNRITVVLVQFIIASTFLLVFTDSAYADSEFESSFSFIITEVRSLTLDSEGSVITPDATAVLTGWTEEHAWEVTIHANIEWVLSIRGTDGVWEGPWPKPVGDIYVACDGGEYVPLDIEPVEVCMGGPVDNELYPIRFRIAFDPLKDIPGDYYYNYIVFEIESP